MSHPYTDLEITKEYVIREFDENIDPIELLWHRDDEDRLIEPIQLTDWFIQLEDELPTLINKPIFIPRHTWHRTIKGSGSLVIKIQKL
jgi:hypothetical protein